MNRLQRRAMKSKKKKLKRNECRYKVWLKNLNMSLLFAICCAPLIKKFNFNGFCRIPAAASVLAFCTVFSISANI